MNEIIETVGEDFSGKLIKEFLRQKLSLSVTLIKKVKFGGVSVNGQVVTMRKILQKGDTVRVLLPKGEESLHVEPINLPLTVLFEDEYILAVDKPTNMPTHPSRYNSLTTLANLVRAYIGEAFVFRAITRLDRDTSGIVLIAKDQRTAARLSEQMKRGIIEKTYEAILSVIPKESRGEINAPIEREAPDSIKRIVREDGKSARTKYELKEILPDGRAVCTVNPITGRTHQIRVHMAHIGSPLYADFLYGEKIEGENYSLRCVSLSFTHPYTDEKITINA